AQQADLPAAPGQFWVELPAKARPFPEPLAEGASPGFKWRGTKGWFWTPSQYLAEIPYLARFKMNFLMNCYGSLFDYEHHSNWWDGRANRWWEDLPEEKKLAFEQIARECRKHNIQFCFSMNPNFVSARQVNDGRPESVDLLYRHYVWMQDLGVQWFNIAVDDASEGIDASSQAKVVNEIFRRLCLRDPGAQMIFCPTYYWGDGTGAKQKPYLEILARQLDGEVYLFWTGDAVVGKITRPAAERFRRISGHRLFLWDNYPVNDNQATMHLGPVVDRDADLGAVIDGYMSNPHCRQNQMNRLPLATCADYCYNPAAYDPQRSIGQAILLLADSRPRREALRDMVNAYPGMLIRGNYATGFNAVRDLYSRIGALPNSRWALEAYLNSLQDLQIRFGGAFGNAYEPGQQTLQADLQVLGETFAAQYGH
ncbi:MAG: beta-N-acetylglucosaminidase domain-containing protein, partial [Sedimentisphaerales bacterium]|nr:beta-N-acetylglucosaminidase domain-containing protein [Sedimentisphaerales bacterium]